MNDPAVAAAPPPPTPSFGEACWTFARIGVLSFGGPAGQIAVMHRILVEEKRWLSEQRFMHALDYCMLLPGPEAQQLSCYAGWLLHGTRGGIVAGALFVLPGALVMLALSAAYVAWSGVGAAQSLLWGLKAAVIAIVAAALVRIARKALRTSTAVAIASGAFAAMALLGAPFPLVIAGAALLGWLLERRRPGSVRGAAATAAAAVELPAGRAPTLARSALHALAWLAAWWAPTLALWAWLGGGHTLVEQARFFGGAAVVTFGGAYALLAYLAQEAVGTYGWVTPAQMIDGLGLAETTPGPLILVTQFVAFLGAFAAPDGFAPWPAAIGASALLLWTVFMPSYLYIMVGAPWIERARGHAGWSAALSGVTAAVVGVIANLGVWFAVHALFREVAPVAPGPLRVDLPILASIDWPLAALAAVATAAALGVKAGLGVLLGGCVLIGLVRAALA